MKTDKQVDKSHYSFTRYMTKERWISVWHQLDEIEKIQPGSVLEIGTGAGLFKRVADTFGIKVETLDIDPELKPDHVGSATAIPFPDATYDAVCAFQMLEHLPYEASLHAFTEMVRVSRRHVLISLPDAMELWRYQIYIPKLGLKDFFVPRPRFGARAHVFDGEHHWEINKNNYSLARVVTDFNKIATLTKTYRVKEIPYYRFFIFRC
jgi:hypothetical protein